MADTVQLSVSAAARAWAWYNSSGRQGARKPPTKTCGVMVGSEDIVVLEKRRGEVGHQINEWVGKGELFHWCRLGLGGGYTSSSVAGRTMVAEKA